MFFTNRHQNILKPSLPYSSELSHRPLEFPGGNHWSNRTSQQAIGMQWVQTFFVDHKPMVAVYVSISQKGLFPFLHIAFYSQILQCVPSDVFWRNTGKWSTLQHVWIFFLNAISLICLDARVKTLKLKQKANGLRLLSSAQRLVYVKKKIMLVNNYSLFEIKL